MTAFENTFERKKLKMQWKENLEESEEFRWCYNVYMRMPMGIYVCIEKNVSKVVNVVASIQFDSSEVGCESTELYTFQIVPP